MKLLVTGGCGFIGSAVIRQILGDGLTGSDKRVFECQNGRDQPLHIVNVDALTMIPAELARAAVPSRSKNYTFIQADIRDAVGIDSIFNTHRPDAVMHLAAETHVDHSIQHPKGFIETNILGTFNLLNAALAYWQGNGQPAGFRFHHVSTDEVYGRLGDHGRFSEESCYNPCNPYSATKASSDHLVRAWFETYGLPVVMSNCSNNFGPFQLPEKLIPKIITCALDGKDIPIYGEGKQCRDWIHVSDHAIALIKVLLQGQIGRSYNIGAENEMNNMELTRQVCNILDQLRPQNSSYSELIRMVEDRPGHDFRYAIDPSRIQKELDWQPKITMDIGLKDTVKWYLENRDWWNPLVDKQSG